LRSGRTLTRRAEFPQDTPRFGWAEVEHKFHQLTAAALDETQRRTIVESVKELPRLADIATLIKACRRFHAASC
jgi:hypothetical protein